MKTIVKFFFILSCMASYSQVGIGTTTPEASLDVRSSNETTPTNTDGILIPKADAFPLTNPTINQDGMLLYITGNGTQAKGFYYWDQTITTWVALSGGSGANTLDQAYDEGGLGNGRVINATDGAVLINGNDGLLITGNLGTGAVTEIAGEGTRLFFNPNKAAFRSGYVSAGQWDDFLIGNYSTAMGNSNAASGESSTAFGQGTSAEGLRATTLGGLFNTALGENSLAAGSFSFSSQINAVAIGNQTRATGINSFAINSNTEAIGLGSTALGEGTNAFGDYSLATGEGSSAEGLRSSTLGGAFNTALGENSIAAGFISFASQINAVAIGNQTRATGINSFAINSNTEASGESSSAFGEETIASGNFSTAMGNLNVASGESSTALGEGTDALGDYSLATGEGSSSIGLRSTTLGGAFNNASGENSIATGLVTNANGNSSFTGGIGTVAGSFAETVFGIYNTNYVPNSTSTWNATDRLFVLGNGVDASSQSNALIIYKNGEMVINDAYAMPITDGTANQILQTDGLGNTSWVNNTATATVAVENGLSETASVVRLGGTLNQNTTIDQNAFNLNYDLSSTGNFNIQDNGITHFQVNNNGNSYFGGEVIVTEANDVGANTTARLFNIFADEGALFLYRNGLPQHTIDAGFITVFNEQGADLDFRIESDTNANMLFVNAGTNRVGIGTNVPNATLDSRGSAIFNEDGGDFDFRIESNNNPNMLSVNAGTNRIGIGTNAPITDLEIENTNTHARLTMDGDASGATTEVTFVENGLYEGSMGFQHNSDYLFMYHGHGTNQNGVMVQGSDLAVGLVGGDLFRANGRIQSRGNVIPYFNNTYDLGNAAFRWDDVYATNGVINTSDSRDKKDIKTLNHGLESVLKLKPVSYKWKKGNQGNIKLGFIAQDLLQVIPEVVKTHDVNMKTIEGANKTFKEIPETIKLERLGVYYSDIIPVLTKAIQEQQDIIDSQNAKIDSFENQLIILTKRLETLEASNK